MMTQKYAYYILTSKKEKMQLLNLKRPIKKRSILHQ